MAKTTTMTTIDIAAVLAAQEAVLRRPGTNPTARQRAALEALHRVRKAAEREVEKLIELLDLIAGDFDLEADEDASVEDYPFDADCDGFGHEEWLSDAPADDQTVRVIERVKHV